MRHGCRSPVPAAPPDPADRAALAGDVVRRITHVAAALRHHQDRAIAELGLTPATARALHELDPDRPLPARDLAEGLGCDRSNVTALVDKLERAGLVERHADPADRRQKTLVVTGPGGGCGPGCTRSCRTPDCSPGSPTRSWRPCASWSGRSPTAAAPSGATTTDRTPRRSVSEWAQRAARR